MKRFLSILLLLLLLLAAVAGVALFLLRRAERAILYPPATALSATPADHHLRYQNMYFRTADGTRLAGWWIPGRSPRATLLYCHGNASNRSADAQWAPFFAHRHMNVLLWDYRGYGDSEGTPSEEGFRQDAQAAFDAAVDSGGGLPVIVYGHSLGGAIAARLALDRPVAGLVLESAFASAADMARRMYPDWPLAPFLSVEYDAAACVAALPGLPKLFGHAPDDRIVPFQSGRTLHAAAAVPKSFVLLEGGHSDHSWFRENAQGNAELCGFLSRFTAPAPPAP